MQADLSTVRAGTVVVGMLAKHLRYFYGTPALLIKQGCSGPDWALRLSAQTPIVAPSCLVTHQ